MSVRTTESQIRFRNPFSLSAIETPRPPGTYRLVVDEEQIEGLSFVAYRRAATMLHLPAIEVSELPRQIAHIDALELAAAIKRDTEASPDPETGIGVQL